ncbi:MAG TPA: bis(5'-nucleosyl)-tetraphosphatase (symmetrical) YqeK [Clostridiales bacterium]|nr:MAG: putative nicotinate-nucleotide adenylyltransferase [Firmicutes bacterium ADurb.Bin262]HOU09392.1 bis(5'-nucleosyl)-tetraphosphatase (symmetrical) YqeK [Clostridiales bacterium]HQH62096.1 bis(5'-nucleosyl)-tetraphosphatase (symmetrical) YqeK [Clostridiales bacterium]HQK72312.1 bis(5'-nucleosyl)-tetraphosphatase (symmetrical) YqeK [Clostridiales bacterium]
MNDYAAIAKKMLSTARFEHSLRVADCAAALARRLGADESKAYECGLLHDIMKDSPLAFQLQTIAKTDIILTSVELRNPGLIHAVAGEAFMRAELGIDDPELLNAVRYHTTGRAAMSLLEKIIYIADYISDDRTYNGVDEMRRLAGESLEAAMLFALKFTIGKLISRQTVIHTDSVECYNELVSALPAGEKEKPKDIQQGSRP